MPSNRALIEALYADDWGDQFVDMYVSAREQNGHEIFAVGGRWDRHDRKWVDDQAETGVVWTFQPAQYEAAHWYAEWLQAYCAGVPAAQRPGELKDIFSVMCKGGRRGGKSDFAVKAVTALSIAAKDSIEWAVSPSQKETEELRAVIERLIPISERNPRSGCWGVWLEAAQRFYLWNGASILMLTGYKPSSLKRGRVDAVLLNESQLMKKGAYDKTRAPLADTGGIGFLTFNPPEDPIGQWLFDLHDKTRAGKVPDCRVFDFDNRLNPFIDWHALELMQHSLGNDDYRREILGEMVPVGDRVLYAWSDSDNVRARPELGNITREVTRRILGREFDYVIGMDFQRTPHEAAAVLEFFTDPEDRDNPLGWFTDGLQVIGTEDDLVDALELRGYEKDRCAIIADASGDWQDAERRQGNSSWDMLRRRGWRFIYPPDRRMKKNPPITDRVKAFNARACDSTGKRRLFAVPALEFDNKATRDWEMRNGAPYRKSIFAHVCDARSYPIWHFFPLSGVRGRVEIETGQTARSERSRDLDGL